MTKRQWVGLLSVATAGVALAQTPVPAERSGVFTMAVPAPAPAGAGQNNIVYGHSAMAGAPGATFEFISSEFSFEGGVVKNAPYSAEAVTETTQRLVDGNRISHKATSILYRDSEGRTRREETLGAIGPWAANTEPVQTIFINDPVSKTNLVLDSRTKTVRKMPSPEVRTLPMPVSSSGAAFGVLSSAGPVDVMKRVVIKGAASEPAFAVSGGFATAGTRVHDENMKNEVLDAQTIEGVRAEGTRTTITIPAGSIGNDLPIQIVSERWYSPELQTVIMTRRSDPRMGDTVYRLTNINRNEPARSLFEAPADYTTVEMPARIVEQGVQEKALGLGERREKNKD